MANFTLFQTIYFVGVLVAFGAFAVSLLTVSIATNLWQRKMAAVRPTQPKADTIRPVLPRPVSPRPFAIPSQHS